MKNEIDLTKSRFLNLRLVQAACNPKSYTREQVGEMVAKMSGYVKMQCGVTNGAALAIMVQAYNEIIDLRSEDDYKESPRRPHPNYRYAAKKWFVQAMSEYNHYRDRLQNPDAGGIEFFKTKELPKEASNRYKELTDEEYFEFWEGSGSLLYKKSLPIIGTLQNKFKLSLEKYGVKAADQTAWALVAVNVLEIATITWDRTMKEVFNTLEGLVAPEAVNTIFAPFSLAGVSRAWERATEFLAPEVRSVKLSEEDERNIELGMNPLVELWASTEIPYDSTIQAIDDFKKDLFKSERIAKKAQRELAELRDDAVAELEKNTGFRPHGEEW